MLLPRILIPAKGWEYFWNFFLFYIREFVALLWSPRITLPILTLKKQESEGLSLCMLYTRKYISQHLEPLGRNHSSSLNKTCLIRCT